LGIEIMWFREVPDRRIEVRRWTPEVRGREAALLGECRRLEETAISHLAKALSAAGK
jgi:hypothetical protein